MGELSDEENTKDNYIRKKKKRRADRNNIKGKRKRRWKAQ